MDDDELPPYLGERLRDAFHDMFRAQHEAAVDDAPRITEEPTP